MKKIIFLIIGITLFYGCSVQPVNTVPVPVISDDNLTPTKVPVSVVTPGNADSSPIPAFEPAIVLRKIREWRGYSLPVAWSNDSKRFAIISDGKLELYNKSLELLWYQPYSVEMSFASAVTFSPDDNFVIVYQAGRGIKLFDVNDGKMVAELTDSNCLIDADLRHLDAYPRNMIANSSTLLVGFSGNNKIVAKRPIQINAWTLESLRCEGRIIEISVPDSESALIKSMSFSSTNDYLVVVSTQGWIKVWDTTNYDQTCETFGAYAIFNPTNGLLAVVSNEGDTLSSWDVEKCELTSSIQLPPYKFEQEMAFSPDGKYLIMRRASFEIFDAITGQLMYEDEISIDNGSGSLLPSPDGEYFFSDYLESEPVTALWQVIRK